MPYIKQEQRENLQEPIDNLVAAIFNKWGAEGDRSISGLMNYSITSLLQTYVLEDGKWNYAKINDVIGMLECVKQEFYSRLATIYEKDKASENGDVQPYKEFLHMRS